MQKLEINATDLTPSVLLDAASRTFKFEGRSLADSPEAFFKPIQAWFNEYVKNPNPVTVVVTRFEYVNTPTQRELLDILKTLEGAPGARVVWQFLEDDEDMEECGQELAQLTSLPFEFQPY
ncbi:MAG: DUF1987 domain-containing protein [Cyclobacteriaceae bacterium]|nr:DUF1987 domain-containing protein [Cyclobacteriaceae bacterium]